MWEFFIGDWELLLLFGFRWFLFLLFIFGFDLLRLLRGLILVKEWLVFLLLKRLILFKGLEYFFEGGGFLGVDVDFKIINGFFVRLEDVLYGGFWEWFVFEVGLRIKKRKEKKNKMNDYIYY